MDAKNDYEIRKRANETETTLKTVVLDLLEVPIPRKF